MSSSPRLRLAGAVVFTAAAVAAVTALPAAAGSVAKSDVRIINTAAEAVPVVPQGTTQVAGTVKVDDATAVRVEQQGPVAVANGPEPIAVKNGPEPITVRTEDQAADEYVRVFNPMTIQKGASNLTGTLIDVPAGKRFIAERVSGEAFVTDSGHMRVFLSVPGTPGVVRIPFTPTLGNEPGFRGQYNEDLDGFVVDGPQRIEATLQRVDPNIPTDSSHPITLFGRLVDCPSCQ